ncbi:hypothetical protein HC251_23750 [Iamia sp. SCSIO 61187]|uniref:hypothetical protein n=1 Tax=Iamia sp. SCSIO 61187 TaxID=2722752 RepID=UPI001C629D72|nr:hypothetical protein [Iamia sp. SCSIO 61187]QYG95142.1 hypothetical protein HC251_23750 [Iamia sp. SCSIO 61187]
MELDHRAAEAASHLRDEVVDGLDVDSAYGRVVAGVGARRARAAGVRVGVGLVVALVAVGALVALVSVADAGPRTGGLDDELALDGDLDARGAAILGALPDGPLDGRESWRLPVVADEPAGVEAGDIVTLYGKGFVPGELVGAVHCSSEADTENAGVGACDLGDGFTNTVSGNARFDGSVVISVPIRQIITTPDLGRVDCATAPERCLLAIGAADDYDRSGGTYISFADAPPFPEVITSIDPAGPYTAGQEVTVRATGLVPGRQFQVLQCAGEDHCASLTRGRVGADGAYAATVAIGSAVDVDGVVEECGDTCRLSIRGIGLPEQTTAPVPGDLPLGPIGGDGAVGSEPPVTAPPPGPETAIRPATTTEPGPSGTAPLTPSTTGPSDPGTPTTTAVPPSTTAPPGESTTTTTP